MGYTSITDAEYEAGRTIGQQRLANSLRALSVRYDASSDTVVITLTEAASVGVARSALKEWANLSPDDMGTVRLSAARDAIGVEASDVQIDIEGLLREALPELLFVRAFAKRGGSSTSPAKANAARRNGARGGRPVKADAR